MIINIVILVIVVHQLLDVLLRALPWEKVKNPTMIIIIQIIIVILTIIIIAIIIMTILITITTITLITINIITIFPQVKENTETH